MRSTDGVYVEGLSEYLVTSATDCLRLVAFGAANRAVRATSYNESSSRSHAILQLQVERQVSGDTRITRSKLNLVDLAGSERWDTNAPPGDGAHTSEMTHINLSLLTLSKCITSLARRDRKRGGGGSASPRLGHPSTAEGEREGGGAVHVPYRESKLTHLLKDALGGNSKTRLVCTLSPAMSSAAESFQTLVSCPAPRVLPSTAPSTRSHLDLVQIFADSAKRVMTHAKVNMSMLPDRVLVKLLQAEVERLRARLLELGDVAGAFGKKGAPQAGEKRALEDGSAHESGSAPPRDPAEVAAALVGMERRLQEANAENLRLKQKMQARTHSSPYHRRDGEDGGSSFFLTGVPGGEGHEGGASAELSEAQEQYALGEASLLQLKEAMDRFFNLDIEEEDLQEEVRRLIPAAHTHWAEGYRVLAAAAEAAAAAQRSATANDAAASGSSNASSAVVGGDSGAEEDAIPGGTEGGALPRPSTPQRLGGADTEASEPQHAAASGGRRRPSSRAGHAGVVSALREAGTSHKGGDVGGAQGESALVPQSPNSATARPTVAANSGNPPASPLTTPRQMRADEELASPPPQATQPAAEANTQPLQRRPSPPTQPLPAVSPPPSSRSGALRSGRLGTAESASGGGAADMPPPAARRELAPVSGGAALGGSGMLMRTRGRDGRLDAPGGAAAAGGSKSTVTLPPLGTALPPDDPEARETAIAERLKEVQREVARREKLAAWMEEKAKRQEAMLAAAKQAEETAEAEELQREKARQKRARAVKKRLDRYKRKLEKQKAAEASRAASRSDAGSVASAGRGGTASKTKKKKRSKKGDGSSTAGPSSAGVHTPSSDAAGVVPGMGGHFPFSPQAASAMTPQMAYALALQQQAAAAMAALGGGEHGSFNPAFLPPPAAAYPWLAGQQVHPALAGGAAGQSSAAAMAAWPLLGAAAAGDDDPNPVSVTNRDDTMHSGRGPAAASAAQADVPWAPPAASAGAATTSIQGSRGAQGMAKIAADAQQAVHQSRGGGLLPTGDRAGQADDLVGSESEDDFQLPVPLTQTHVDGEHAPSTTSDHDVPLNFKYGGLSAPPVRSVAEKPRESAPPSRRARPGNASPAKREKPRASPRPATSSGGADALASARSNAAEGAHDADAAPAPAAGGGQVSPREQREHKARSRQQQLAAVYAAPVVGKARSSSRPKLRGLYNNAGFDREEEGGGAPTGGGPEEGGRGGRPVSGGYSDDDFEYERAGEEEEGQEGQDSAAGGGSGTRGGGQGEDALEQSAAGRIDAGAAGNLLNMLDDL